MLTDNFSPVVQYTILGNKIWLPKRIEQTEASLGGAHEYFKVLLVLFFSLEVTISPPYVPQQTGGEKKFAFMSKVKCRIPSKSVLKREQTF